MPKVSDLFEVVYGHSLELNRLPRALKGQGIAFVSRQMGGNGISAWVKEIPSVAPAPAGELSCALGGNGVLTTHLQEQPYYTGRDVARLIPKVGLKKTQLLFYAMCIKANRYRFSYGRQANRTLKDLDLPAVNSLPSYVDGVNVDQFIGSNSSLSAKPVPILDTTVWSAFALRTLFDIRKGTRITKANMKPGNTPFISALDGNNGLRQKIDAQPQHPAGVLTVNYNGNGVAESFYQPEAFCASDDVNVLYPRFDMNIEVALFISAILTKERYRFSYGRKWNLGRMRDSIIRLPTKENGHPDFEFMQLYISTLPFSATVRYEKQSEQYVASCDGTIV